jgi:ribosomal-protein-alanine N-acetyltransferase
MGDYGAWAELRAMSRAHLTIWEPQWSRDELTRSAFRRRLRQYQRELREDQGYAFFILRASDATLIGGLSISNVRRGVAQAASIGYWIGAPHAGNGYMTDALRAVLPFTFATLALNRLEAACQPNNGPSRRVLEKVGFRREGLARRYLKINGAWQDHDLYALLHDDVPA